MSDFSSLCAAPRTLFSCSSMALRNTRGACVVGSGKAWGWWAFATQGASIHPSFIPPISVHPPTLPPTETLARRPTRHNNGRSTTRLPSPVDTKPLTPWHLRPSISGAPVSTDGWRSSDRSASHECRLDARHLIRQACHRVTTDS